MKLKLVYGLVIILGSTHASDNADKSIEKREQDLLYGVKAGSTPPKKSFL